MSTNCKTSITVGGTPLKSFQSLDIHQSMYGHHSFSCTVFVDHIQPNGNAFSLAQGFVGKAFDVKIDPYPDQVKHNGNLTAHKFKGLVTHAFAGNHGGEKGQATITLSGSSPTFILDDESHIDAFHQKDLTSIFTSVLGKYGGISKNIAISGSNPMKYVIQWRENSWQFIRRMCARFGVWCYYDGLKLHLCSSASNGSLSMKLHADLLSFDMAMKTVSNNIDLEWWDYSRKEIKGTPDLKYATKSVGFTGGNAYSSKSTSSSNNLFAKKAQDKFMDSYQQANKVAEKIKKSRVSDNTEMQGRSNNPGVAIAKTLNFTASDKGESPPKAPFFVTEVHHHAQGNGEYSNTFKAIPKSAANPYADIIKAPICEEQSGIVVDNNDPQLMGRLKVRLRWQESGVETDWIRLVLPYAGKGKGMYFLPEKDEEVWVGFEGGDPEKPYVMGMVYHKEKGDPTAGNVRGHANIKGGAASNDIKNIQTRSGHSIELNDKKGGETITIKDKNGNQIKYDTVAKTITIDAPTAITLNSTTINLNAQNINFDTQKFTNKDGATGKDIKFTAKKNFTVETEEEDISLTAKARDVKIKGHINTELVAETAETKIEGVTIKSSSSEQTDISGGSKTTIKGGEVQINRG